MPRAMGSALWGPSCVLEAWAGWEKGPVGAQGATGATGATGRSQRRSPWEVLPPLPLGEDQAGPFSGPCSLGAAGRPAWPGGRAPGHRSGLRGGASCTEPLCPGQPLLAPSHPLLEADSLALIHPVARA